MRIPAYIGAIRTEEAVIVGVTPGELKVVPASACSDEGKDCHGCKACGESRAAPKITVPVGDTGPFTPGQSVTLRRLAFNEGFAAAMVFGFPLALGVAAMIAVQVIRPGSMDTPWAMGVFAGALVSGLALSAGFDRMVRRRYPTEIVDRKTAPGIGN